MVFPSFRRRSFSPIKPIQKGTRANSRPSLENLEARQLLAADGLFGPADEAVAIIQGFKWEDTNASGGFDRGERGLPGVTIYADMNANERLDRGEPTTITQRDNPNTNVDESGHYELLVPGGGEFWVREVVPAGFEQTYPLLFTPGGPNRGPNDDVDHGGDFDESFATVEPNDLHFELPPGEEVSHPIDVTIHPFCFVPVDVDIVSQDPRVNVHNLSGVQTNGCGGDVSTFEIVFVGAGESQEFLLSAIDANSGHELGTVIVTIDSFGGGSVPGGHFVAAEPGQTIEGLDFGNYRIGRPTGATIVGTKWSDTDGDGDRDENEPGLGGVIIYLDANGNGRLDRGERSTETLYDNPFTDFDEAGHYEFDVRPGDYTVREVVPRGYEQTFPLATANVVSSETGEISARGHAIDFDVTGIEWTQSAEGDPIANIEFTAEWPDGGERLADIASYAVIGDHIIVDIGSQFSPGGPDVISYEQQTVSIAGLNAGSYTIAATLHETIQGPDDGLVDVASEAVVAEIIIGADGAHYYSIPEGDVLLVPGDFGNHLVGPGASLQGTKWHDKNGNGFREDNEPGLAGVTIYLDANSNGMFDEGEVATKTAEDDPDTRFDETGQYSFEGVQPGSHTIGEVVPDGYRQTFPWAIAIDPLPGQPILPFPEQSHFVNVRPGEHLGRLDFGNQSTAPGSVHGTKWLDSNGNGARDDNEPGLAGVTIYADLNYNGQLDEGEPSTVSMEDIPETDFDEAGMYWLDGLKPNSVAIREVVPDGYAQTFPAGAIWFGADPDIPFIDPENPFGGPEPRPIDLPIDLPFPLPRPFPGDPFNQAHYVNIVPGEAVEGIDFGNQEISPGSIHGTKWLDQNGNSQRDDNEPGLGGVTIYVDANYNGQLDEGEPSTVTMEDDPATDFDEAGMYWLEGINPGSHVVREVVPDGYMQTFPSQFILWGGPIDEPVIINHDDGPWPVEPDWPIGGPVGELPDGPFGIPQIWPHPDWFGDDGHHVFVGSGETVEGVDFGNQKIEPGSIHGTKWLDQNGNAEREADEPGLAGVTIYLDLNYNSQFDEGEPHTVTMEDDPDTAADESGMYWIENIDPGFYHLREVVPDGFEQTFPINEFDFHIPLDDGLIIDILPFPEGQHYVHVGSGQTVDGLNFGNRKVEPQGVIEGTKWEDRNGDAERQDDEPGLGGVIIFADLNLNGELDPREPRAVTQHDDPSTANDEGGTYSLLVPGGDILVMEIVPRGYKQIHPSPFRRVAHPYNLGHIVSVDAGGEVAGIDFGNQRNTEELGVISGTKWIDFNANGIREDDEPGEANVAIYIDANNNGQRDRGERTTYTQADDPNTRADEAGNYSFTDLAPGTYIVREEVPFGFAQSFPNQGVRFDSQTIPLSPGSALDYTLSEVYVTSAGADHVSVSFDMDVTWPNGCGSILEDQANVEFDGNSIIVHMVGMDTGGICTQAIVTQTQSLGLDEGIPTGGYAFTAILMEQLPNGDIIESFMIEGKIEVGGDNSHHVRLGLGEEVTGRDFGNFPVPVPEPEDFDFNGDGRVDDMDIDAIAGAMHGIDESREFDITNDGTTDRSDVDHLVENVLNTVYGDSNLDGLFDSSDLVAVFQSAEYEDDIDGNSTWADGDWNGDGDFTTQDLVFVFQKATYSRAASPLNIDAGVADRIWSLDLDKKDRKAFIV